ncbi:hypothetical protein V5F77_16100 [Xanthobacter sp. DSM 24535]|uniref:hypothetical protein n=1 Tax=Roseixanthobacter psychrophilus TaxID=3119917 RepID=UPI003726F0C9
MTFFKELNALESRFKLSSILTVSFFAILSFLYVIYVFAQNADVFFESQFLHLPFLRNLVNNTLTPEGFFTVYGEHMFPGYNLILGVNYYLFGIWGGFDSWVYALTLWITTAILIYKFYQTTPEAPLKRNMAAACAALIALSTNHNPQWGMALAAAIGVTMFVAAAAILDTALCRDNRRTLPIFFVLVPLSIVLFLGGYAIGSIAGLFTIILMWIIQYKTLNRLTVESILVIILSLLVYIFITSLYGSLLVNRPNSFGLNLIEIAQFGILMVGSSLIGRAFFEMTGQFWPFYLSGVVLIFWTIQLWCAFALFPARGKAFVVSLSAYSIVNIAVVAIFRYRNGADGAFGQWYMVHTQFISISVLYYLWTTLSESKPITSALKIISIILIIIGAMAGYYADWRKAPYFKLWKEKFAQQAPILLGFPERIQDRNNIFQTMLWPYNEAKASIDFIYDNKLWEFKSTLPITAGVTSDGWITPDSATTIVCPSGSQQVKFTIVRPENWPPAVISILSDGQQKLLQVKNEDISIRFSKQPSVLMLDGSDESKSVPMSPPHDQRKLIGIISAISCE